MPRRDSNSQDTKEKIFAAAAKLFAVKGYDSASVRDIAKEAEVNLALINYHFKDKKQLLESVIRRGMDMWSNLLEQHRGSSLEDLLRILMRQATDREGAAYYMNIFMRMFLDSSVDSEVKNYLFMEGAPKVHIVEEAVAKKIGKDGVDRECKLIAHYLMNNMIFSSRICFGVAPHMQGRSVLHQYVDGEDVYIEQLLELSRRLCRV